MQPHELQPLRKRLTPVQADARAVRIWTRRMAPAKREPIVLYLNPGRWFQDEDRARHQRTYSHTHDGERRRRQRARERHQERFAAT